MNRRRFLIGAAAIAAAPRHDFIPFSDGQSVLLDGREYLLSDIVVPSSTLLSGASEPGAEFALAAFDEILRRGTIAHAGEATDRWGRMTGALAWRLAGGRLTTIQELLLGMGAARVAPESDDMAFIDRCFAVEDAARSAMLGAWSSEAWRVRDATRAEWSTGFQIYDGVVKNAEERRGRVYVNFGDDYRKDFTATVTGARFRRWTNRIDVAALVGRKVEVRGLVERINGPSIELLHEKQLRLC
ncbi:MAG: hypothetical protein KDE05_15010 [Parvularculaceae bacterium]|nr:hypothetical protein [Parvularculaceae bacterium]